MRFLAIDVETANPNQSTICAVGAVLFEDGKPAETFYRLVNPEDYFDPWNIKIHGITDRDVRGQPTFPAVFDELKALYDTGLAICHTHFDRGAMSRAAEKYCCDPWNLDWLDSARIARRAWPDWCSKNGAGLASVANHLGIEFKHHNAAEDARAAGLIVCRALGDTGIALDDWPARLRQPVTSDAGDSSRPKISGNPAGPFFGETVLFTGTLQVPRKEAAAIAGELGFNVAPNISRKVTLLVIGDHDAHEKNKPTGKHQKALGLIAQGHPIRIITEADFVALTGMEMPAPKPKAAPEKARRGPADLALSITLDDDGVLRMSLGDESIEARIAVAQDEGWQSVDEDDGRA